MDINKASNEYYDAIQNIEKMETITINYIFELDSVFEYMQLEAHKDKIRFELKLNGSIHYMIENFISVNKLATLLSDHIKDALIAIRSSSNSYKSIELGNDWPQCVAQWCTGNCHQAREWLAQFQYQIERARRR